MADVSELQQLQHHDILPNEHEDGRTISLPRNIGLNVSASDIPTNAYTLYCQPSTGDTMDAPVLESSSGPNIQQSLDSTISLLSPDLQIGFDDFWPTEELSQSFSWPWLYEESYLQQPPALADVPIPGNFLGPVPVDHSQIDFRSYLPNPSSSSTAYLDAFANSTMSVEQPIVEPTVQSPLPSSEGEALRMRDSPSIAPHRSTQASLQNDTRITPSLRSLGSRSQKRARGIQIPTASTMQQNSEVTKDLEQKQHDVVQSLIDTTFQDSSSTIPPLHAQHYRSQPWGVLSLDVERAFSIRREETTSPRQNHILHKFVTLYFKHFNRLWPLVWQHGLNFEDIPGPLYLTLAMIGSMYAPGNAPAFGFMAHEYISKALMLAPTWRFDADDWAYSICQSLCLTQVAALYFGTKKAFSSAQQLGYILVSQARKIGLFKRPRSWYNLKDNTAGSSKHTLPSLSEWTETESRKRLAFGIFRADTFLSLLLNTQPLLSYKEISLGMPSPYFVWEYSERDLQAYIKMSAAEDDLRRELPFSDLVYIAMDREETLPSLKPGEYELLLFGLQQSVWRFSHDPDIFQRLTGRTPGEGCSRAAKRGFDGSDDQLHEQRETGLSKSEPNPRSLARQHPEDADDVLDWSHRRMNDLYLDHERTLCALRKWKQSFAAGSTSAQSGHDRDLLLSSRLLYHLSFIRLNAEVEAFHLLSCQRAISKHRQRDTLHRVYQWSHSSAAQAAVDQACTIWTLVHREIQRPEDCRARFNIVAFISLHHAASVIWAYAGTRGLRSGGSTRTLGEAVFTTTSSTRREHEGRIGIGLMLGDLEVCHANTHALLTRFADMLRSISSGWVAVSAFATRAAAMAENPLPVLDQPA